VAVTGTLVVAVTVTLGGAGTVTLGRGEAVAVLLGRLPTALWAVLPHPAARQLTARMTAGRERPLIERRMLSPPRC
jgi:hypothetical protein